MVICSKKRARERESEQTSSVCPSSEWSFVLSERMSHSATVLSAEPVARMYSEKGLKATQLTCRRREQKVES